MIDNDVLEAEKSHQQLQLRQFKTTEYLNILRNLAKDHNEWKNVTNVICNIIQGELEVHIFCFIRNMILRNIRLRLPKILETFKKHWQAESSKKGTIFER